MGPGNGYAVLESHQLCKHLCPGDDGYEAIFCSTNFGIVRVYSRRVDHHIGTRHMLDLLTDITEGRGTPEHLERLETLAEDIRTGSLCNLGKTAPNPVLTTLRFFREEYEAHIHQQTCPAKECKSLTAYYIVPDKCARACDACVGSCPVEAIFTNRKQLKVIDQSLCVKCNACMDACPPHYDAVVKISPLTDLPPQEPRPEEASTAAAADSAADQNPGA